MPWRALLGTTGVLVGWGTLVAQDRDALIAQGRRVFADQRCYDCHTIGPAGSPIGPDLARVGSRYSESMMARWLRDPSAQEPTRHMPRIELSEVEVTALAAYLASLR